MHELSIALSIIDIAEETLKQQGDGSVSSVLVKIGPMSGVVTGALISAFELAREGTSLANSQLIVEETPLTLYCAKCQSEQPAKSIQDLRCQCCDTFSSEIVRGREMEIVALEVDS